MVESIDSFCEAIEQKVLRWINRNIRGFYPFSKTGEVSERRLKALVEALVYCDVVLSYPNAKPPAVIKKLQDIGITTWSSSRYLSWAIRTPSKFRLSFAVGAFLYSMGYSSVTNTQGLTSQLILRGYVNNINELSYHKLDFQILLNKLIPSTKRNYIDISHSLIGMCIPPLEMDRSDVYHFTHLVFYLKDWGRNENINPEYYEYAQYVVIVLLPVWTAKCDWDVVGELIIVGLYVGLKASGEIANSLVSLFEAQKTDGSFPMPRKDSRGFFEKYHTVLVIGIMVSIWKETDSKINQSKSYKSLLSSQRIKDAFLMLECAILRCSDWIEALSISEQYHPIKKAAIDCIKEITTQIILIHSNPQFILPDYIDIQLVQARRNLLAAVSSFDLIKVGIYLNNYIRQAGADLVAFEVILWLLARQHVNGHFCPVEKPIELDQDTDVKHLEWVEKIQFPITVSVLAGIASFLSCCACHPAAVTD